MWQDFVSGTSVNRIGVTLPQIRDVTDWWTVKDSSHLARDQLAKHKSIRQSQGLDWLQLNAALRASGKGIGG